MLIYVLVVIFPLVMGVFYNKNPKVHNASLDPERIKKIRKKYIFIAALPMFTLIALRNRSIGADTGVYMEQFERMVDLPWANIFLNTRMEQGYIIFIKLISLFTDNPLVYQAICATIYFFGVISFVNELDENPFFVLFLFGTLGMYTFMFTGVRQCIAISICLLSFNSVKQRKIISFVLYMILAFNFHHSSILFIVAYLIYPVRLSWKSILAYSVITFFSVRNLNVIQEWFNEELNYDYGIEGGAGGIISTIIIIMMVVFCIFIVAQNHKITTNLQGLINIGIIAAVLWFARIFTRVAERPSYYFLLFVFAAFVNVLESINPAKTRLILKIFIIIFALILFMYKLLMNRSGFVPYTIFSF